jgi:sister chromatid cohesion protein DCC1
MQQTGYHPDLIRHCLQLHGGPVAGPAAAAADGRQQGQGEGEQLWALDGAKVCLHAARKLLQRRPEGWSLEQLMAAWQAECPEELTPTADMLRGEVLLEEAGGGGGGGGGRGASERGLKRFPASALPSEPAARFQALFAERGRWEASDLEPYLAGVTRVRAAGAPGMPLGLLAPLGRRCPPPPPPRLVLPSAAAALHASVAPRLIPFPFPYA